MKLTINIFLVQLWLSNLFVCNPKL